jgi:hypothetical protein
MELKFKVPDETFETYVKNFGVPGCYAVMRRAVETFKNIPSHDRYIFLAGDDRRAVEAVFQTTVESGADLAKKVQTLSRFAIGGVEIEFTAGELQRMDMQAQFHGLTREKYIHNMATEIKDRMLEAV